MTDFDVGFVLEKMKLGFSSKQIATALGISVDHLYYMARKYELVNGKNKYKDQYTWAAAIQEYLKYDLSVSAICKKYNISESGLRYQLKKAGIKPDHTTRKYWFNNEIFSNPTSEFAYHMGFGLADGTLGQNKGEKTWQYQVCIHYEDRPVLENWCSVLGIEDSAIKLKPVTETTKFSYINGKIVKGEDQVKVTITHHQLKSWLEPWGIIPDKTHCYHIPEVPGHLFPYFLIGWIDGDGSVSYGANEKTGYFHWQITLGGPNKILDWGQTQIQKMGFVGHIGHYDLSHKYGVDYGRLQISGKQNAIRLLGVLPLDEIFHLHRKWDKLASFRRPTNAQTYAYDSIE